MKTIKALFKSYGGVHPPYRKDATAELPIETMSAPKTVLISMSQHLGAPSKPMVKKGDAVLRGQTIGESAGFVSAWVHSSVSGVVKSVDEILTVSGRAANVIEIESDGENRLHDSCKPAGDWKTMSKKAIAEQVSKAGIVGMGGAGFPTHVKLSPPEGKTIDTLIINGAECEPYLTADHRLMVEFAGRIWNGANIIRHALGARSVRVAIEDNKPDAIKAMEKVMTNGGTDDIELVALKTEYPQGAEKQLIYSVLGREVPSGGLPMDVGALVENVGTALAIDEALTSGLPLIRRVVTVTGDCVRSPKNILAYVGTPLKDLVEFCGGLAAQPGKIICGGPMMGIALSSLDAGMGKTTSGLLLMQRSLVESFSSLPCIGCGRCVGACPMALMPCTLSECIEAEDYENAECYDVMDCIECGSCAFVCPAHRPLVQHMKQAKAKVTALRRRREAEKQKALAGTEKK